jgi:hypothetical protein
VVPAANGTPIARYDGMMDALYKIAKYEGIRGLYKVMP